MINILLKIRIRTKIRPAVFNGIRSIKERLALLENIQQTPSQWGILQNYKNRNGEAPLVRHYKRNAYKRIADTLGIERYQSVPLYLLTDTLVPERYGEDGSLVRFLADGENFVKVSPIYIGEEWYVPKRYVKVLPDTTHFIKTIMIDRSAPAAYT